MFENLSDKLQRSFKNLRGEGTLTEENISDAIREIRLALLESDVNLAVVNELIEHIRTRALGVQVATALSPQNRSSRSSTTSSPTFSAATPPASRKPRSPRPSSSWPGYKVQAKPRQAES